eukprot:CAMPEP_0176243002 /NCGR_PEP_ID=MMETSP0121_2-20121125/30698_1 /TAXON_ID=160619 /ORGANISM="Kryptoperidinium foliaceum, Strain CCMP 1326" /LENGTH=87 /DNA_ID=CAMNT_0017582579 /DNA_START=64 /DNA_END=324 /DNA_ORIENTATION=-
MPIATAIPWATSVVATTSATVAMARSIRSTKRPVSTKGRPPPGHRGLRADNLPDGGNISPEASCASRVQRPRGWRATSLLGSSVRLC